MLASKKPVWDQEHQHLSNAVLLGSTSLQEGGKLWRQKVYDAAVWGAQVFPRPHSTPPTQRPGPRRTDRPVRRNFAQTTQFCLDHLPDRISDSCSALLAREHDLGGRGALGAQLVQMFHTAFGPGWRDFDAGSLLAHLDSLPEWAACLNDLLLLLIIESLLRCPSLPVPPAAPPAPYRLTGKQPAARLIDPRFIPPVADAPPRVFPPRMTIRPENCYRIHQEGNFSCALCNRVFPSGSALASHVCLTHTKGTFREAGFGCSCCPRIFRRESALRSHLRVDHAADAMAEICPRCQGVFPGRPTMLLHLAQDHEVTSFVYPMPCPLCVQRNRLPVRIMTNPLTFKRRRTSCHMRDRIRVYDP